VAERMIVVGGVAAGMSAAARARRTNYAPPFAPVWDPGWWPPTRPTAKLNIRPGEDRANRAWRAPDGHGEPGAAKNLAHMHFLWNSDGECASFHRSRPQGPSIVGEAGGET
jgi:hypothetical protein